MERYASSVHSITIWIITETVKLSVIGVKLGMIKLVAVQAVSMAMEVQSTVSVHPLQLVTEVMVETLEVATMEEITEETLEVMMIKNHQMIMETATLEVEMESRFHIVLNTVI